MLQEIEKFTERFDIAECTFGRMAVSDPRLIGDLRNGRRLRRDNEMKVRAFMKGFAAAVEYKK